MYVPHLDLAVSQVKPDVSTLATMTDAAPARNRRAEVGIVAAALPSLAVLVLAPSGNVAAGLTTVALGGSLWMARVCVGATRVPRTAWPVFAALAVAAVTRAPMGSHDLWSYAFLGRVMAHYGGDPYSVVANQHPNDLVFSLVKWRNTPSGYGPLFTLYSAGVAKLAGQSLLLLRLGFQIPVAASVLACLRMLSNRGRIAAVVLIGLQPVIWLTLVNGGHNDALMAVALLGAVVAFTAERTWTAAILVAVAVLIKLSAALIVIPICVVLMSRRRWSQAIGFGLVSVGPVLACGLVLPRSLANASRASMNKVSMSSIWRPVKELADLDPAVLSRLAMLVVLGAAIAVSWRRRGDQTVSVAAGSSLSLYPLLSNYTLPWYTIWGLPALALTGDLILTGLVAARGSLMTVAYQLSGTGPVVSAAHLLLDWILPPVLAGAFLIAVLRPTGAVAKSSA